MLTERFKIKYNVAFFKRGCKKIDFLEEKKAFCGQISKGGPNIFLVALYETPLFYDK